MEEKREDQRDKGDRCGGKDDVDDKLLGQEGAAWLESGASSGGAYYGELRVWLCRNRFRVKGSLKRALAW